jgi:hypothetical protein
MILRRFFLLLLVCFATSCSKSVVYSPSLNLPTQSLQEKELDFSGGVELMPEARPEALGGRTTTMGAQGQVSYGFGDKFNLGVKAWFDAESREISLRSGYSLNARFFKELSNSSRLIYIPRAGIALSGNDISGYGFGLSSIYQKRFWENTSLYFGPGILWGFRYLEKELTADEKNEMPMGFALIGNIGFSQYLGRSLRLNIELNPVYQLNTFEDNQQFLLAPSLAFGYLFSKSN